jgi:SPP1 gp7 family putative phage head morphogenesis protein
MAGLALKIKNQLIPWVKTTVAAITNKAKLLIYELNPQSVPVLEWTAIIDNRTSTICRGLDGSRWYTATKKPLGNSPPWRGPPPAHFRCRSTLVPTKANAPSNEQRYDTWLRGQPPEVQREVLGRTRYDMWSAGKISSVKDLTDQTNRPLTVAQLREKYGA